jgi:hypothetical protein
MSVQFCSRLSQRKYWSDSQNPAATIHYFDFGHRLSPDQRLDVEARLSWLKAD